MRKVMVMLLVSCVPLQSMEKIIPPVDESLKKEMHNLPLEQKKESLMNMLSKDKSVVLDVKFHDEKSTGEKAVFYSNACLNTVCTLWASMLSLATLVVAIVALAKDCK